MNIYAKILYRADYTKTDGTNPIYLRLTIHRKVKYYSLNISVIPGMWDEKKCQVKKAYPNSYRINLIIDSAITRANNIIFDFEVHNKSLTFSEFKRLFNKKEINSNSFYEFVEKEIEEMRLKYSPETIRSIKSKIEKLKSFAPKLIFSDIDLNFIKAYDTFIITKTKNCDNTRFKALSVFKSLINRAIKNGHIKENPFKNFPISKKAGKREFLSMEELSSFEELSLKTLPSSIHNVLQYFLFACYTGLRFQDIKDLRFKDIDNDMISIIMHKTKERVTIPLSQRAKNLLYPGLQNQKIFRVYVNQVTNRYLKEISKLSGVNKKITFHSARHTFATIGISLNIPVEVISKLLGHMDLKTTQIYAKVMNDVKIRQMEKWDTW